MTPREAAIALNLIPGLGPVRIMRLLQVFASPELILESPSSLLMEIPGVGRSWLAAFPLGGVPSTRTGNWNWRITRGPR